MNGPRTKENEYFIKTDALGKPMFVTGFDLSGLSPSVMLGPVIFDAVTYNEEEANALIADWGDKFYKSEFLGAEMSPALAREVDKSKRRG